MRVKISFDSEGDFLEVIFDTRPGFFRETLSDQVMAKVDERGRVLGFSILGMSGIAEHPLEVAL